MDALLLNFGSDCPVFTKLREHIIELPIAKELQSYYKVNRKIAAEMVGRFWHLNYFLDGLQYNKFEFFKSHKHFNVLDVKHCYKNFLISI